MSASIRKELLVHNGRDIPEVDPVAPGGDVWIGLEYLSSDPILSSSWLINGLAVAVGETVDGLTLVDQSINGVVVAARIKTTVAAQYRMTNEFSTASVPLDRRSMDVPVRVL